MKNVFEVTIMYHGGTRSEVCVIASDDVKARNKAVSADKKSFSDNALEQPRVEYCEVRHVCEAVQA